MAVAHIKLGMVTAVEVHRISLCRGYSRFNFGVTRGISRELEVSRVLTPCCLAPCLHRAAAAEPSAAAPFRVRFAATRDKSSVQPSPRASPRRAAPTPTSSIFFRHRTSTAVACRAEFRSNQILLRRLPPSPLSPAPLVRGPRPQERPEPPPVAHTNSL